MLVVNHNKRKLGTFGAVYMLQLGRKVISEAISPLRFVTLSGHTQHGGRQFAREKSTFLVPVGSRISVTKTGRDA